MDDFAHDRYLAGFVDGEGCLAISKQAHADSFQISLRVAQRLDSRTVLDHLNATFGGTLCVTKGQKTVCNGNAQIYWQVSGKQDILRLIAYFDEFPLVAKAPQYAVWREAALLYFRYSVGHSGPKLKNPAWLLSAMQAASSELRRLKQYNAPELQTTTHSDTCQNRHFPL